MFHLNYLEQKDLTAFCESRGMPDFFVTLTANDSWPELKWFLNGVPSHFRPVESTVIFIHCCGGKEVFFFGIVCDHWQRIEFQNRAALHIHILIWVD